MLQAKPLSAGLNRAILALSPAHIVREHAPSTFAEVMRQATVEPHRLIVWSGGSDATIYGDPAVNWAFRAWHDACHVAGGFDFTLEGERMAAELQCQQLETLFPNCPKAWPAIIRAEVNGQAEYLAEHGAFPLDQFAFVRQYLETQGATMARDLDFAKVQTPEGALTCLRETVKRYQADAANLDACGMVGKPWEIIAAELEKALERAEKRVAKCYPLNRSYKFGMRG